MPGQGWDVRRVEQLASTNDFLVAASLAGAPAGTVVVAAHQTAGRGRLGRRWESPPGACLLASVLLRPCAPPGELFAVTAALALAAADACGDVAGVVPGIKWPNDLVIGHDKVAGILAESVPGAPGGGPGTVAVVAGIGCNVTWPGPPEVAATSLLAHAPELVAVEGLVERLLGALLDRLAPRAAILDSSAGRRAVVADLRDRCVTVGQAVRVALPGGVVEGVASAIDPSGHLVVRTARGPVTVSAGDVVHVRPPDGAGRLG